MPIPLIAVESPANRKLFKTPDRIACKFQVCLLDLNWTYLQGHSETCRPISATYRMGCTTTMGGGAGIYLVPSQISLIPAAEFSGTQREETCKRNQKIDKEKISWEPLRFCYEAWGAPFSETGCSATVCRSLQVAGRTGARSSRVNPAGETEAGAAGEQPVKGYLAETHSDESPGRPSNPPWCG
jgi:hypothetical protein